MQLLLSLSTGVYSRILASLKLCVVLSLSVSPSCLPGGARALVAAPNVGSAGRQAGSRPPPAAAYGRTVTSTSAEAVVMSLIWGAFLAAAASVGGPLQQPAAQQSVVLVNQA